MIVSDRKTGTVQIKTYRNNTESVTCSITGLDSLGGFTPYLTVKDEIGGVEKFSVSGSVNGLTVSFDITPTNNDIPADTYVFDIVVSDTVDNYTVVQGEYIVLESVKYT